MGTQKTVTNRALDGFRREANSTRSPVDTKKTNNRALGDDGDVLTLVHFPESSPWSLHSIQ